VLSQKKVLGLEKGRLMDLVYLKQEHMKKVQDLGRERHRLLSLLEHHNQEAIKLTKKIEQLIIEREI